MTTNKNLQDPTVDNVAALQAHMQEIAHLSAFAQNIMCLPGEQDPEGLQMIFEALIMIEKITGCKGDGSFEFWLTRFSEE